MTEDQTNIFRILLHRVSSGKDLFILENHDKIGKIWELDISKSCNNFLTYQLVSKKKGYLELMVLSGFFHLLKLELEHLNKFKNSLCRFTDMYHIIVRDKC
jgi:hypothetical protein